VCVYVCVFVCARACACLRHIHLLSYIRVCVCVSLVDASLSSKDVFALCCVHLAVLGTVRGGLASSAHEWLLQRLAAVLAQGVIAVALARCVPRPVCVCPGHLSHGTN